MGENLSIADSRPNAETPGAGTLPMPVIEERFERLLTDLEVAIMDPVVAHRLETFDFNAVIRVKEAEHLEAWCLFHGTSEVDATGNGATADIEVTVPASLLGSFWTKHLAMEILEGRATYTGRVRQLLTMMPVIRAAVLRRQASEVTA